MNEKNDDDVDVMMHIDKNPNVQTLGRICPDYDIFTRLLNKYFSNNLFFSCQAMMLKLIPDVPFFLPPEGGALMQETSCPLSSLNFQQVCQSRRGETQNQPAISTGLN